MHMYHDVDAIVNRKARSTVDRNPGTNGRDFVEKTPNASFSLDSESISTNGCLAVKFMWEL